MIANTLTHKIGEAMKAKDSLRLSVLRMLSSEFNYEKIKLQHELNEQEEQVVVRREAKKRKEAILAYNNAHVSDKAKQEEVELEILSEFLPPELTEEEVVQLVNSSIESLNAKTITDLGKVIADVKSKNPNVDGGKVAALVRARLV